MANSTERQALVGSGLLRAVTDAVVGASSRAAVEERACSAAADAGFAFAAVVDADASSVRTAVGVDRERFGADVDDGAGREAVRRALDDGETRVVAAPEVDPTGAGSTGVAAVAVVPLRYDGETYGALALGGPEPGEATRERLAEVGRLVAHGVAAELERGRRTHTERRLRDHRRKVEQLHAVARELLDCEDEAAVLERAVGAAREVLEFDVCGVYLAEDGYLVPRVSAAGAPVDGSRRVPTSEGIAGKTYRSGESYLFDDVQGVEAARPADDAYRSVISVPIDDLGVFQAAAEETGVYTGTDLELAELLLSHVAGSLKRLSSERALGESERQYRTLVEGSHDAIFIYRDGEVAFVNDRTCELTGYDREELLGRDAASLLHPADRAALAESARAVLDGEEPEPSPTARVRRKDGETVHCEFRATTISYEGETALLGSVRDVSAREERERRLERQNERLDEFAGIISHDLRNPLSVARGSLELARESGDEDHLDRADRALDRMESLVDDVLDLARKGRIVDETEPVALGSVVRDAWRQITCPEADLAVAVDGAVVDADRSRLQTFFENLFRNAVEHAGPAVDVEVGTTADGFYVADDGPGIPPGERERVFERGYTTEDGGTGFGLAIARNVVEAHGWTVEAVDDERGARFEVRGVAVD